MQIKLPVDVHLAVGDDGKMLLLIGGLIHSCKPEELADVLSSKPLKLRGKRRGRPPKSSEAEKKPSGQHSSSAVKKRLAKGLCAWCDHRPVKGKKLCSNHLVGARKAAEAARIAKKRAA